MCVWGGGKTQLKPAFTLAEVLITLVIIGVIAAITVPTLMAHQRKIEYVTQLKKAYSTLSNGFRLAMTKDGVNSILDTTLYTSMNGGSTDADDQTAFIQELSKTFASSKIVKGSEIGATERINYKALDGSSSGNLIQNYQVVAYTNDGMIITFHLHNTINYLPNSSKEAYGTIYVDVNGEKKPNQWGRDTFRFYVEDNGIVTPWGMHQTGMFNWTECTAQADSDKSISCAARIMNEGWEMKY